MCVFLCVCVFAVFGVCVSVCVCMCVCVCLWCVCGVCVCVCVCVWCVCVCCFFLFVSLIEVIKPLLWMILDVFCPILSNYIFYSSKCPRNRNVRNNVRFFGRNESESKNEILKTKHAFFHFNDIRYSIFTITSYTTSTAVNKNKL